MKKVLVVVVAALLGGMVFASDRFELDDGTYDYFDSDTAYAALSYEDGAFRVKVSDKPTEDTLELVEGKALPSDEDVQEDLSAETLQESLPITIEGERLTLRVDADLEEAVNFYDTQFAEFGFSSQQEKTGANSFVKVYDSDDLTLRVVFTRQGSSVNVFMHTL